ncbi:MAG TPA: hypothetical protein VHC90_09730 [Bryobacteraceae bacterium]|nr:hypothetical protein [Bryobacteraceae bacterium]
MSTGPQVVAVVEKAHPKSKSERCAGDYSAEFHGRVIRTFEETLSVRKTARECKIPSCVVNEILHARDFVRRPPSSAAGFRPLMRRIA